MTVLLFLVDTSASMAQTSYQGLSYLDHARYIVAQIRKGRESIRAADRYMLFTTEDFPKCVKAGFREGSQVFEQQCSSMRPRGRYHLGQAVLNAFKYLNTHRAACSMDQFGYGRWVPLGNDNVVVILITDPQGAETISPDFQLMFTGKPCPASELTEEAFRWDQRVFSVVLRLPSLMRPVIDNKKIEADVSPSERMCAQTGGRSFAYLCHEQTPTLVSQILSAMSLTGAAIHFESALPAHRNGQSAERTAEERKVCLGARLELRPLSVVYVRNRTTVNMLHWPMPEGFYPQNLAEMKKLPLRKAHPTVLVASEPSDPHHIGVDMPFDKLEVEPGPLTEFILEKQNTTLGWQVFVQNSARAEGYGKPFGYLKAASNLQSVSLYVLPYNYPSLLPLLEEFKSDPRLQVSSQWRNRMQRYMETVPQYYLAHLRRQLRRYQIPSDLFPDNGNQHIYNPFIQQALSRLRHVAKEELDNIHSQITSLLEDPVAGIGPVTIRCEQLSLSDETTQKPFKWMNDLSKCEISTVDLVKKELKNPEADEEGGSSPYEPDNGAMKLTLRESIRQPANRESMFRNPLMLRSRELIAALPKLRANFEQSIADSPVHYYQGGMPGTIIRLQNAVDLHNQPVVAMGAYDEYLKALTNAGMRPREVEPVAPTAAFGNPFKMKNFGGVDEVGENPNTGTGRDGSSRKDRKALHEQQKGHNRGRKKAGPLGHTAMQQWRTRRRTISEVSSIVSDLSYTSDLNDLDMEVEESGVVDRELNGMKRLLLSGGEGTSGMENGTKPVDGLLDCGVLLDSSSDVNGEPSTKKAKLENGHADIDLHIGREGPRAAHRRPAKTLTRDELRIQKYEVARIIKRIPAGGRLQELVHEHVFRVASNPSDQVDLLQHGSLEAERFKRRALASGLRAEVEKRRKVADSFVSSLKPSVER